MAEFGALGAQESTARRRIVEQVVHLDGRTLRVRGRTRRAVSDTSIGADSDIAVSPVTRAKTSDTSSCPSEPRRSTKARICSSASVA